MKFKCPHCEKEFHQLIASNDLKIQSDNLILLALKENGKSDWTVLEKITKLGSSTLSRRLKALAQQNKIKREVINSFPPKTFYYLVGN